MKLSTSTDDAPSLPMHLATEPQRGAIGTVCQVRGVLGEALQAFYRALERFTLADGVRTPEALSRLLFVGRAARTAA